MKRQTRCAIMTGGQTCALSIVKECNNRAVIVPVGFVVSDEPAGRNPVICAWVQPARTTATTAPMGSNAQRANFDFGGRFERTGEPPRKTGRCPFPSLVAQWNESPHAHDPCAFGLSIVKPCFWIESSKSIAAPSRYGTIILSKIGR